MVSKLKLQQFCVEHMPRGPWGSLSALGLASFVLASAVVPISTAEAQGIAPVAQQPAQAAAAKGGKAKGKAAKAGQPAQAEAAKVDPAVAERQLEAGIKSYQAGKHEAAVQSLNGAMQGGGLPSARMARALYYRGLAYKAQGKPAQSISDLTSAVWLKGGLDDKERADALAQRAAAYREAGLGEPPALDTAPKPARTAADAVPASAKPVATAAAAAPASGGGIGGFFSNLFGGSSEPAAPAPAHTGSVPSAPKAEVSSWTGDTKTAAVGVSPTAPAKPAPVKLATAPSSDVAPSHVTPPQSVAATAPPSPPSPTNKVAAATPAAPAPAAASAPAASGRFKLQVAAVRTKAEADAIAAKLKKEMGRKLASRDPVVDEAAIGNMGTFYRVRIGPYADANEPRRLCVTLRAAGGYDCLVVQ